MSPAEDREAAAREHHRGRVREEFARVLEDVEQPRADEPGEERDEADVGHEIRRQSSARSRRISISRPTGP